MATHSFVEIELPEAARLESLTGISYDLMQAQVFAKRLKAVLSAASQDPDLIEPLWIAAIVQYFRAFGGGGARHNLNEVLLSSLNAEQRAQHDWLYEVRGRHIVHSVNTFEKSQTIARYVEEDVTQKGITSIQCNHHRVVGPSPQDVEKLIGLTDTILEKVKVLADEERGRVLAIVRKMPISAVLSGGAAEAYQPDMDRPEKRRKPAPTK